MRTIGRMSAFACVSAACLAFLPEGDLSQAAAPEGPVAVTTVKPERKTLRGRVKMTAVVEAFEQTKASARSAGYVRRVYVEIGDRVKKGQVLAELEVPELVAEL